MSTDLSYLKAINYKFKKIPNKIENLQFKLKEKLFLSLGIPIKNINNLDILEFGPGSGFTAKILVQGNPKSYTFVEPYEESIKILKNSFKGNKFFFIKKDILNFNSKKKYDYIILEGVLPGIENPNLNLKHLIKYLKLGGVVIFTTTSPSSFVSDALRRSLKPLFELAGHNKLNSRKKIKKILENQFKNLKGQSRNIDNWIDDTVFNPMKNIMYTFGESLKVLNKRFEYFASSPNFFFDHTWYKQRNLDNKQYNRKVLDLYQRCSLSFLNSQNDDYSCLNFKNRNQYVDIDIKSMCIYKSHLKFWFNPSRKNFNKLMNDVKSLSIIVKNKDKKTYLALEDFVKFSKRVVNNKLKNSTFGKFDFFFGRGLHHFSFIRVR